eukprot:SAG31_NODE_37979_length_300_cov_0.661692_1_plen_55_part_00
MAETSVSQLVQVQIQMVVLCPLPPGLAALRAEVAAQYLSALAQEHTKAAVRVAA